MHTPYQHVDRLKCRHETSILQSDTLKLHIIYLYICFSEKSENYKFSSGEQKSHDGDRCIIPLDGISAENCLFFDDRTPTPKAASLMYKQFLDQVRLTKSTFLPNSYINVYEIVKRLIEQIVKL